MTRILLRNLLQGPATRRYPLVVRPSFAASRGRITIDYPKCIHCGACLWNCSQANPENPERMNIAFKPGTGGLHSAEN